MTLTMVKKMVWTGILIGVLTACSGIGILQAEDTVEQRIAALEAKAKTITSYQADMAMTIDMMGQKMVSTGICYFKKPRLSRIENDMDMGTMKMKQIIVSDGKMLWTSQPAMKMVAKIDLEKVTAAVGEDAASDKAAGDVAEPFKSFDRASITFVRKDKVGGKDVYVFRGNPQMKNMEKMPVKISKIESWVGVEDGLVRKMVMIGEDDKEMMSQTYTNVKINVAIDPAIFVFTPPEGAQIMDMTEGSINMMKEMKGQK
ncbi:outer membrane lipoprotein carrier protein LolA [bacterium]|nr:outer membrane lipoprotein carrier protein LolA [bacterium]